jgi:hypothetical protein
MAEVDGHLLKSLFAGETLQFQGKYTLLGHIFALTYEVVLAN